MDNNNQNTNPYSSSDPLSGQNQYGNTNPADNNMYQNPADASANNMASNPAGNYNSAPYNNAPAGNSYNYNEPMNNNANQAFPNNSGNYNYSNADYYDQQQPPQSNGYAIAAMILGILSIPLGCCYGLGIIFSIIAIVMAFLAKKNNGGSFGGMALTGLICACIGILFGVLFWVFFVIGLSSMSSAEIDELMRRYQ